MLILHEILNGKNCKVHNENNAWKSNHDSLNENKLEELQSLPLKGGIKFLHDTEKYYFNYFNYLEEDKCLHMLE